MKKSSEYTHVLVNDEAIYAHEIGHTLDEWKEIIESKDGLRINKIIPMRTWLKSEGL